MFPFASIVIPTYNGKALLETCLGALRRQTYPAERFEVVVVDDASSDGSVDYVRKAFPWVRVVALEQNSGFVAACNAGAAAAQGEVLVLLNNDTEAEPGWLEALVAALQRHPEAGSAASKMLLFEHRDILHAAGDTVGADGIPRNRGVWQRDCGQYDQAAWVFGACGGAAAYRRQAWQQAGGFSPQLFMYLEDVDLAWRLQLLGWKCLYVPEARVYHQLSATGGGPLASYYTGRNTLWVIVRNWPDELLHKHWREIVAAQGQIALDALRAWRGKAARARLRGQVAGLVALPGLLHQRKAIQRTRKVDVETLESLLVRE